MTQPVLWCFFRCEIDDESIARDLCRTLEHEQASAEHDEDLDLRLGHSEPARCDVCQRWVDAGLRLCGGEATCDGCLDTETERDA